MCVNVLVTFVTQSLSIAILEFTFAIIRSTFGVNHTPVTTISHVAVIWKCHILILAPLDRFLIAILASSVSWLLPKL